MPKIAKELSPLEVSRLDKTGFNAVGVVPGLGLQIRGQARSWILRVKIGDKVRDIGLGGYPGVTLAMARETARQMRSKIAAGIDPIQERKVLNDELRAAQRKRLLFVMPFVDFWKTNKLNGAMPNIVNNGKIPFKPMPYRF